MGYTLCIAEKPSVAEDIAKVVNAKSKNTNEGYYIGNGYIVTWAYGHLITLAEPEMYNESFKKWSKDVLPIIPDKWKLEIIESTKNQFYNIKNLINRDDVDLVIDCGDMGAQGHYIQWLIRLKAGCKKPVKKLCATSLTEKTLRNAFTDLKDINDYSYVIMGEYCKARADWIIGMCLTRYFTCRYQNNLKQGEVLSVGRVQTPTCNFVIERFLETENFVSSPYWQIVVNLNNSFNAVYYGENKTNIADEKEALIIFSLIDSAGTAAVCHIHSEIKNVNRPQLYDITELQRDGSRMWNYSPNEVLDAAQALYDKYKVITYPRTDSRYITCDVADTMKDRIKDIGAIKEYKEYSEALLKKGLNLDKRVVNDKKVTDHHALVVTENIKNLNLNILSQLERDILRLIINRMLIAFDEQMVCSETKAEINIKGYTFKAGGRVIIKQGWKGISNRLFNIKEKETDVLPDLVEGDVLKITNKKIVAKKTEPPKLYTYDTLLTAMENAGDKIEKDNEMIPAGIGTQATRAGIIKELYNKGYITNVTKGKRVYIIPTDKALFIKKIFPRELLSPSMTARWQYKIKLIEEKKMNPEVFLNDIKKFVKYVLESAEENTANYDGLLLNENAPIGKCPWCGKDVYAVRNAYRCETESCGFFIHSSSNFITRSYYKKELSESDIKKLIGKSGLTLKCKNQRDIEYQVNFKLKSECRLENNKKYPEYTITFVNKKQLF